MRRGGPRLRADRVEHQRPEAHADARRPRARWRSSILRASSSERHAPARHRARSESPSCSAVARRDSGVCALAATHVSRRRSRATSLTIADHSAEAGQWHPRDRPEAAPRHPNGPAAAKIDERPDEIRRAPPRLRRDPDVVLVGEELDQRADLPGALAADRLPPRRGERLDPRLHLVNLAAGDERAHLGFSGSGRAPVLVRHRRACDTG